MRSLFCCLVWAAVLANCGGGAAAQGPARDGPAPTVLVELYTSQGCDMCPEAERLLGVLADREPRVAPVAFHVDYFNEPWKDPYSDNLHSRRQMAYNSLYTKPKNPEYGLYYTPMLMVDGEESVNGRDPAGALAAVRRALAKAPQAALETSLDLDRGGRSGDLRVKITARSPRLEGRELLVCAVLRDDRVVNRVLSGENANKTLTARFPARATKFEFIRLGDTKEASLRFPFRLDPSWETDRLAVVAFVQDKLSGAVYRTSVVPWRRSEPGAGGETPPSADRPGRRR
jgi:hypothetical protein